MRVNEISTIALRPRVILITKEITHLFAHYFHRISFADINSPFVVLWPVGRILSKFLGFRQISDSGAAPKEATAASRASYIGVITTKISGHSPYKFRSISPSDHVLLVCVERSLQGTEVWATLICRILPLLYARSACPALVFVKIAPFLKEARQPAARPLGTHCRIKTNKWRKFNTNDQSIEGLQVRLHDDLEPMNALSPASKFPTE